MTDCTAAESVTLTHLASYSVPDIVPPPDPKDLLDVKFDTTADKAALAPLPPQTLNVGAVV